ncbi:MAG: adenylate cyclase, partial [Gaiellaceae bacterium]|nr:adenylate cyclase [Gaiellaceae bacterium]
MTEPVALESILSCFRGVIPAAFATCGPDGVPNITYMSIIQYVDSERVALSRQFFNKTSRNLDANPASQALVVDPDTAHQYTLDLEFLHTETR